ncbi:hypothetical protein P9112_012754 [Eukaryota sp. TZLM1-RC]
MADLDALRSQLQQLKLKATELQDGICQLESLIPPFTSETQEEPPIKEEPITKPKSEAISEPITKPKSEAISEPIAKPKPEAISEPIPEFLHIPEQSPIQKFFVYTDGSCLNNQGRGSNVGGMGVYIELNGQKFAELNAGSLDTTNNKMELLACIEGLKYLKQHVSASQSQYEIVLLTDSQYVKNGIESWVHSWKRNNWKTSNRTDVKNRDLWQQLDQIHQQLTVQWKWVRGHAQCFGNQQADRLAVQAAMAVRDKAINK